MLSEEKEVWLRAYNAYASGRSPIHLHLEAYQFADQALEDFKKRFPEKEISENAQ